MNQPKHLNVTTELESVRPLYDFVLVRRLDDDGSHYGKVILPDSTRNPMKPGVKQGKVIACGAGDKVPDMSARCMDCEHVWSDWGEIDGRCPKCQSGHLFIYVGPEDKRADMHVKPGDTVLYQRAPANNVVINGGEYVFLHEESQILAVIEA